MGSTKHNILQTLTRQTDNMSQWYCLMPIRWTDVKLSDLPLLDHSCGKKKTKHQNTKPTHFPADCRIHYKIFVQSDAKEISDMRYYC